MEKEKEKDKVEISGADYTRVGGVNPNSHDYEIQQLKTDIAENLKMLKLKTLESSKLSQNMKFIVYDLANKVLWRIDENTLHDPYDFIIAIKAIAHEFNDNDIVEIAGKVKHDILVLDNLLAG